ncbi:FAD-binding oxidoreductase [Cellulomonas sp. 73-145]|uniref:NAD(P)/FAD-dependent oxidoreductase n=1 Tax=Cellulomonas sp. 73-145 TaxID=1895739 RepID=UPI000A8B262B|nr:FAD-binding oxidoreductase [Cellulomonas sp. 73-145]
MASPHRSLWWDQLLTARPQEAVPRPPLDGDTTADVAVVGAGLTGLWTAYYLQEADPGLDVLVLDQDVAGAGASGRSSGWCSARLGVSAAELARLHGAEGARDLRAAMRDAVVEVGGVAAAEHLACDFTYAGTVSVARNGAQLARLRAHAAEAAAWGDELELLGPDEVATHLVAAGVLGGAYTPDCAFLQPAALVRQLADLVVSRGARLVEHTRAVRISPRAVVTLHGTVRARWVVRAVEAWSAQLPGSARDVAPVRTQLLATEPLDQQFWERIGLRPGGTFEDVAHLALRGVRTTDDRLVLGGRAAGGAIRAFDEVPGDLDAPWERFERGLRSLFPAADGVAVTHRWGGPVGVPRDGHPSVGLDAESGLGWAGGYGDDGVAAANLAGRTLADLVTGADSPLVHLPWVGHRSPRWARGVVRSAEVTAAGWAARLADEAETLAERRSGGR